MQLTAALIQSVFGKGRLINAPISIALGATDVDFTVMDEAAPSKRIALYYALGGFGNTPNNLAVKVCDLLGINYSLNDFLLVNGSLISGHSDPDYFEGDSYDPFLLWGEEGGGIATGARFVNRTVDWRKTTPAGDRATKIAAIRANDLVTRNGDPSSMNSQLTFMVRLMSIIRNEPATVDVGYATSLTVSQIVIIPGPTDFGVIGGSPSVRTLVTNDATIQSIKL